MIKNILKFILKNIKEAARLFRKQSYNYAIPPEVSDINKFHIRQKKLIHPPAYLRNISVQPIAACNLKCVMCDYSRHDKSKSDRKPDIMSMELFRKVIDTVEGKVPKLGISGMGEPLMYKDLNEMISYASQKGMDIRLTTNGLLLTKEKAVKLFEAGLGELRISVDGATTETYEKIRTGGSFERLMQNLEMLRQLKAEKGYKTKIVIHTVFQTLNMHEFNLIKPKFKPYADKITCKLPYTWGSSDTSCCPFPTIPPHECIMLTNLLSIHANGDISICCNNYHSRNIVGNANTDDILDVWKGKLYNEYRLKHYQGRYEDIELCKDCRLTPMSFIKEFRRLYNCR